MHKICEVFDVDFEYFVEDKKVFKVKKNIGGIVGDNATINNNVPEGILENMLKRIALLESQMK
jgi:hypothetical protein